jgi:DNA polymerase-3 subunit alpha
MFSSIEKALEEVKEFKDHYNSGSDAKLLIDSAKRLEGVARHASMHACGVVITRDPVTEYTPLQRIIGKEAGSVTQYSSSTKSSFVEKIGLLKMDFLGLKNLTIIQNTLRIARKTKNFDIKIDDIPLDDQKAFELLQQARTTGVFQLESSGMKRYLKLLKPNVLEDIIAMVALYRPGPMDWIPDFISRKHGEKQITYLHPNLKPILEKTYGVAVYQEQVMQIARALAGFTLGEADVLRKAMGKKIFDLIQEQKIKFIEGCVTQGIDRKIGEKVFSYIEPFAGYGFNRSHAACYALVGYQTAYLKAHFPAEFMAALLTSDQDNIERVAIEVAECREMGIEVLPPDVNESFEEFAVIIDPETKAEKIRFGLNAIKNVGHTVAGVIVEERKRNGKFKSLTDFIQRVESKDLNKKSIEALAKVGALEKFAERNQVIVSIENILAYSKNFQNSKNSNQISLFGSLELSLPDIKLLDAVPADKKQRLSWEKELLGLYISDHPVKEYMEYFRQMAVPIQTIGPEHVGRDISVGGIITTLKKIFLKNQKTMMFVSIEDIDSAMELIVFPKVLDATANFWEEDKIILAQGKISDKDGNFKLLVDRVTAVDNDEVEKFKRILATKKANGENDSAQKNQSPQKVVIKVPANSDQLLLKNLSAYFNKCEAGDAKIYLEINGTKLETPFCVKKPTDLEIAVKNLIPASQISFL